MKRYIKSAYENYSIQDQNKFSEFVGNVESYALELIRDLDGYYDILGTQFVTDYGYQYELIIRDISDRPTEIGYITIDLDKSQGGFVKAWYGSDEDTAFASGKQLDDIFDDAAEACADVIEKYEKD